MILALDTETTGFVNKYAPWNHPSQPHLVQLGLSLIDPVGLVEVDNVDLIIRPEGKYAIPKQASDVHGVTTERAEAEGVTLLSAIETYAHLRERATVLVMHNADYDKQIMAVAVHRSGYPMAPFAGKVHCTKDLATDLINLPPTDRMRAAGFNKPKPPRLEECVKFFFDEKLEGAHSALVDARACGRVFCELIRRGVVQV